MTQLLQNAVYGTALILAAALLRRALKDRLIPEARLALWAACLFRLLTPNPPESVLSLWGLIGRGAQSAGAPVPGVLVPNGAGIPAASNVNAPAVPAPAPAEAGIPWEMILLGVWLAAGAALGLRYALAYVRTRRAVGHAVPIGRDDPRYAPMPRCARLREGVMDGAPLTFGAVRPTVVLSPGLDGAELACVLAHEAVHARRRDNLWHYAMTLALVLYWWNPAVWLMTRLLRQDVELACDRAAVKKLGADKRAEYAKALVSMATAAEGPAFCQTFGRKAAEERIISIMKYKKTTVIGAALTLALVLAVTVGFASNPAADVPDGDGNPSAADPADETVEYYGKTYNRADLSQETLDWLDWYLSLSEEGQMSVSMVPPELIPQGDAAAYDVKAGDTEKVAEPDENTPADPAWPVSLDGYKALLDQLAADGKVSQEDADWLFAGAKQAIEQAERNGQALVIKTNDSGSYAMMPAPLCDLADCGSTGVHTHDGLTYRGWTNKHAIAPFCTDKACEGFAPHWHENGGVIFYNGYGEDVKLPVCPVEGCATPGVHIHDVIVYACNGAHSGGVCDGSCFNGDEPIGEPGPSYDPKVEDSAGDADPWPVYPTGKDFTNGTHHSEMYHGESHHGNGHH